MNTYLNNNEVKEKERILNDQNIYNSAIKDIYIVDSNLSNILFIITIITALSAILMLNMHFQKPKLFYIIVGILLSVIIYYINFFFGTLGKNEKIPLLVSIWIPILTLSIICLIGIIRINEK